MTPSKTRVALIGAGPTCSGSETGRPINNALKTDVFLTD